ncbi:MAG: hypothetical protein VW450_00775 [Chloroflexota bacterium]
MPELDNDAFAAWAAALGINASREHLEVLRREVGATLARLEPLDDITVDDVPLEYALGTGEGA